MSLKKNTRGLNFFEQFFLVKIEQFIFVYFRFRENERRKRKNQSKIKLNQFLEIVMIDLDIGKIK
ncbi:MAG: hypothetical protein CMM93_04340 [Rickettsiales bacterium]|nr:hypothetical protein [Rickettsiales bacterium]